MEKEQVEVGDSVEVQFGAPCTLKIKAVIEAIEGGTVLCRLGEASMRVDAYAALNNGEMWYREEDQTWVLEL